jgi:curved DNA-binding protein CbpA
MPSSLLKKATFPALYNYSLPCCCGTTSPSSPRKRLKPDPIPDPRFKSTAKRTYADVKHGYEFRDNMNWPCRKSSQWTPSPYEIFDIQRNAVYTKHKFYELVKIYHPDRSGHASLEDITHHERIERYRLVVQAHEILSDPVKRRAYDASGAGWGSGRSAATRHSRGFTNGHGQRYGYGPDDDSSIFQNATWEDWERWYRRHDNPKKQKYSGTFVQQNSFASFIILLAVISGVFQATRAGQYSGRLEEKVQEMTAETRNFLDTRENHYQQNQIGMEGRIKHFLEKRDPSKYGLKDEEGEAYRKHFSSSGVMQPMPRLDDPDAG